MYARLYLRLRDDNTEPIIIIFIILSLIITNDNIILVYFKFVHF